MTGENICCPTAENVTLYYQTKRWNAMSTPVYWEKRYIPSGDVIAREIAGEVVIVPLIGGIGEADDDLFTVNTTGKEIWRRLDGTKTLREVANELQVLFEAPCEVIERDVQGFIGGLLQRRIVAEVADH
jgi:hypothetical protein